MWRTLSPTIEVTPEENQWLQEQRRKALSDCTEVVSMLGPLPVRWRKGWRAELRVHERAADGDVRATVYVRGPALGRRYVRRLRCVLGPLKASDRTVLLRRRFA